MSKITCNSCTLVYSFFFFNSRKDLNYIGYAPYNSYNLRELLS